MDRGELADSVGYCGLVCVVCSHAHGGCLGCRRGGGDEQCHQRACCVESGLNGCWECEGVPCDKGYFAGPEWSGLCSGFTQVIRDQGVEALACLVTSRLGEIVEYGDYRLRQSQEVKAILCSSSDA
jgi:hypothetical protein